MVDWADARGQLSARGFLGRRNLYLLATSWRDGGKLDQAVGGAMPVRVLTDPHGYAFRKSPGGTIGSDALILVRPDRAANLLAMARPYFSALTSLPPIVFGRSGRSEISLVAVFAHRQLKLFPQPY
jgi:hypothetical protein